jgi:hypothetical protein
VKIEIHSFLTLKVDAGVVSILHCPPYPQGKDRLYALNKGIDGTQTLSKNFGGEINTLPLSGIEIKFLGTPSRLAMSLKNYNKIGLL